MGLYERIILTSITRALKSYPKIQSFKVGKDLGLGLSCYKFQLLDHDFKSEFLGQNIDLEIYGLGFGFNERLSIIRAWAEFLERYSFYVVATQLGDRDQTTNGYACHTFSKKARNAALAELVERDMLLTNWLLRLPSIRLHIEELSNQQENIARVRVLKNLGAEIEFGIMGTCMGFLGGIGFVGDQLNYGIVTSANRSIETLLDNLVLQASALVESWMSPTAPQPIESLPEHAWPIDHLKFYLRTGKQLVTKQLLAEKGSVRHFPAFDYKFLNLTSENPFALSSGFSVCRAITSEGQDLWIGPTRPEYVNLERLSRICGRPVRYENVNQEPHPLP